MVPTAFHENTIGTLTLVSTDSYALATTGGVTGTNGRSLKCSIVPPKKYAATLAAKCPEQTRAGARKWGLG
jgi:hypothetical protein